MIFKMGEIYCGPGGMALGAKQANINSKDFKIKPIWANDIDKDTCETYKHNISPTEPDSVINMDIRLIDVTKLKKIDAFAFGFPCNDFSIAGKQKGFGGKYGPLYTYGIKVLEYHQPKWFVAENVGGLKSANDGKAFKKILYDLQNAGVGYTITPHLYKFEEYGVPQARHRIIIVGFRNDLNLKFKVPKPNYNFLSSKEALESPPILETANNHEYTRHTQKVIEMLKHIPPGENAWYHGIPKELRLNVKNAKLSQIYKRLDPNKPAYTVTGSGGGGTHIYHYSENRALTNRERARLQTFPDEFLFIGGKESVRKQIGMAVPPKGAKFVFEAVLKTLAKIEYDTIPSKMDKQLEYELQSQQFSFDF